MEYRAAVGGLAGRDNPTASSQSPDDMVITGARGGLGSIIQQFQRMIHRILHGLQQYCLLVRPFVHVFADPAGSLFATGWFRAANAYSPLHLIVIGYHRRTLVDIHGPCSDNNTTILLLDASRVSGTAAAAAQSAINKQKMNPVSLCAYRSMKWLASLHQGCNTSTNSSSFRLISAPRLSVKSRSLSNSQFARFRAPRRRKKSLYHSNRLLETYHSSSRSPKKLQSLQSDDCATNAKRPRRWKVRDCC